MQKIIDDNLYRNNTENGIGSGRKKNALELRERDLIIMRLIFDQGFITLSHAMVFFPGSSGEITALKRLSRLEFSGLLKRVKRRVLDREFIYLLTKPGERKAITGQDKTWSIKAPRKIELEHDALVTMARLHLQRIFIGSAWAPEAALPTTAYPTRPDGILRLSANTFAAIEFENNAKSNPDYHRIWRAWNGFNGLDLVLYIAVNDLVYRAIERLMSQSPKRPLFGLTKLQSLAHSQTTIQTSNGLLDLKTFMERAA